MELDVKSQYKLSTVKPDLQSVIIKAAEITDIEFVVTCGIRTKQEQEALVAKGASKTMKSKHLTGDAVDLAVKVDGKITWDWEQYKALSKIVKHAAEHVGVPIVWGGDWTSFRDGPHYQLASA